MPIESSHALSHKIIDNIKSVYLEIDQALDRAKMEFFIGELLWEGKSKYGVEVMRCKGIFYDKNGQGYMLQGVQDLFEFNEIPEKQISTKFLFVVKGTLNSEILKTEMI